MNEHWPLGITGVVSTGAAALGKKCVGANDHRICRAVLLQFSQSKRLGFMRG